MMLHNLTGQAPVPSAGLVPVLTRGAIPAKFFVEYTKQNFNGPDMRDLLFASSPYNGIYPSLQQAGFIGFLI